MRDAPTEMRSRVAKSVSQNQEEGTGGRRFFMLILISSSGVDKWKRA